MMRHDRLEHTFVEHIPETVETGILYISMKYGTAAHSCCCGCGEEVVTPFTPTDWKMIFDGETVSLNHSVGNWTLDCRSHYVIKRGRVIKAGPWTDEQVAAERLRDQKAKSLHYAQQPKVSNAPGHTLDLEHKAEAKSIWQRIWHFFR